jgi:hypothetical protein
MTLVLIWLALSVIVGASVCRLLALSGPGNPEKVIHTGYSESFSENRQYLPNNNPNNSTDHNSPGSLATFAAIRRASNKIRPSVVMNVRR